MNRMCKLIQFTWLTIIKNSLFYLLGVMLYFYPFQNYAHTIPKKVIKNLINSVVSICVDNDGICRTLDPNPGSWFYLHRFMFPPVQQDYMLSSGIIMNKEGYILTTAHGLYNGQNILVTLSDKRQALAKLIGVDQWRDLAVIKINLSNLTPIKYISHQKQMYLGQSIYTFGDLFSVGQSLAQGIISGLGFYFIDNRKVYNYIQTDAVLNPGGSGGALVDEKGNLLGINAAIYSNTGSYEGIGFSIPIEAALYSMKKLLKYGHVPLSCLGLTVENNNFLSPRQLNQQNLINGVKVVGVNATAEKLALKVGDIIVKLNRYPVNSRDYFQGYLYNYPVNTDLKITYIRQGKQYTTKVKTGIYEELPGGIKTCYFEQM